jgi:hypothetical protein
MKGLFALPAYRIRQETTGRVTKMARSLPLLQMANVFGTLTEVLTKRCLFHSSVSVLVPYIFSSDKKWRLSIEKHAEMPVDVDVKCLLLLTGFEHKRKW